MGGLLNGHPSFLCKKRVNLCILLKNNVSLQQIIIL